MVGRVKRALLRGVLAGSLVLAIMGAVGLVGATTALADTGYTISRHAGQANSAGGATPGPALSSQLSFVVGAGLDPAGNLYIVDPNNVEVEKVTPGGTLSIFAGTGQSGPPVPGPASNSTLNNPAGVASDSAGNVYIADQNNHVVEKVAPDGTLSVFAGIPGVTGLPTPGPATSSHLDNPWAIATDAADNVYIADYANKVIEKVTPAGHLSVIAGVAGSAGTPTAGPATSSHLTEAVGVAVDSAGNVYIADAGPNVIAKVTPGGTLSIIAGISGTSAQPTPGLATASALSDPAGIGVDSAGAVYVADAGANVIEKITPAGQLSVIAGNGSAGHPTYGGLATATSLDLPLAMVVDPAGNVYVADALNFTIDRLTPPAPVSTAGPAITGSAQVGQTLSTDGGSWDNAPFTETFQWQGCDSSGAGCAAIPGATSHSYPVTDADSGHTIRVVVTTTNGGGSSSASSAATALVAGDTTVTTPSQRRPCRRRPRPRSPRSRCWPPRSRPAPGPERRQGASRPRSPARCRRPPRRSRTASSTEPVLRTGGPPDRGRWRRRTSPRLCGRTSAAWCRAPCTTIAWWPRPRRARATGRTRPWPHPRPRCVACVLTSPRSARPGLPSATGCAAGCSSPPASRGRWPAGQAAPRPSR